MKEKGLTDEILDVGVGLEARQREEEILTHIKFLLEPYMPEDERLKAQFDKWTVVISRTLAVSYLPNEDYVYHFIEYFEIIKLWMKLKRWDIAVDRMARLLMELQLLRSVRGFERTAQITTRHIAREERAPQEKKKRRLL
ncbi:MAG: hypothetical protein DRG33_05325 [Deltaproteobacteria bacterium]|nr:MAG: hypothetical protein DRG33_05325 [Deltaproteobacteria bacterium]